MIKDKLFLEEFDEEPIEEARKTKRRCKSKKTPYSSMTITTGDIGLNIDRFNTAMGTADMGDFGADVGISEGSGLGESLITEAKRYVRRYYLRPQNLFASNKADVLKALIEIGNQNCTIYTLNNLGDDKDVAKLTSRDIIYTFDDGILRDKNGIQIMDYDLSIKKEENRKKFINPDPDSKEFKAEYEDRMTSATELEESVSSLITIFDNCNYEVVDADYTAKGEIIVSLNHNAIDIEDAADELINCLEKYGMHIVDWNTNGSNVFIFEPYSNNEFDVDFDDINVYGERLNEAKENFCSICGEPIEGHGHITDNGVVCDGCELHFAIGG